MHLQNTLLGLITLCISAYTAAAPTELDHYLIQKQITDSKHVIKNADALNEILKIPVQCPIRLIKTLLLKICACLQTILILRV